MKKNKKKFSERVVAWLRKDPARHVKQILAVFAIALYFFGCVFGFLLGVAWCNPSKKSSAVVASAESGAYGTVVNPSEIGFVLDDSRFIPLYSWTIASSSSAYSFTLSASYYYLSESNYSIGARLAIHGCVWIMDYKPKPFAYVFDPSYSGVLNTSKHFVSGSPIGDNVITVQYFSDLFPVLSNRNVKVQASRQDTSVFAINFSTSTGSAVNSYVRVALGYTSPVFYAPRENYINASTPSLTPFFTSWLYLAPPSTYGGTYTPSQYQQYGQQQFTSGKNVGYNEGYNKGLEVGGNNNFFSLMSAVVDAPITALTSALDVEVLGFNLKDVFLSILTTALVIAAIKFFTSLGTN